MFIPSQIYLVECSLLPIYNFFIKVPGGVMSDIEDNNTKIDNSKKIMRIGHRTVVLSLLLVFCALLCQWGYWYYKNNTLKFPWGTKIYTVSAEELNLLPNEQANYLGTRATEDDQTEFLYHANNMYLRAASAFSIRTGPGVYYQSIGRMFYGRDVHVIATCDDNDWYMIDFYGEEAYVHSACLFDKLPELTHRADEEELTVQGSRSEYDLDIWEDEDADITDETEETAAEQNEDTEPAEAAVPTSTPSPTPSPAPTQAPSSNTPSDPVMLELFNLVNNARAAEGLAPLSWSNTLAADAAVRAQEIVSSFSHTRPDGSDWWTVDPDRMYGENLASGQSTAQEVFNSWMASPGHRANILGDYTTCGFALHYGGDAGSTYYWAQEFGY